MTDKVRNRSSQHRLNTDELDGVIGGATEELRNSHNFLLEVAGITPDQKPGSDRFTPPIGSGKGS